MTDSITFSALEDDESPGRELVTETFIIACENNEGTMQLTEVRDSRCVDGREGARREI